MEAILTLARRGAPTVARGGARHDARAGARHNVRTGSRHNVRAGALKVRRRLVMAACPDCDAVQAVASSLRATQAFCFRCGALIHEGHADGDRALKRALAFTLAAVPLFIGAQTLPLLRLDGAGGAGDVVGVTVCGAAKALYQQQLAPLAALVILTTVVLPALRLAGVGYLVSCLRRRRIPRAVSWVVAALERLRPWSQTEILLFGVLVAFGKLATVFHVVPGAGLFCMLAVLVLDAIVSASFNGQRFWSHANAALAVRATGSRVAP